MKKRKGKVAHIRGIIRSAGWVRWMGVKLPLLNQGARRGLCEEVRFKQGLEGEDILAGRCLREEGSRLWEQGEQRPKRRRMPFVCRSPKETRVAEAA